MRRLAQMHDDDDRWLHLLLAPPVHVDEIAHSRLALAIHSAEVVPCHAEPAIR